MVPRLQTTNTIWFLLCFSFVDHYINNPKTSAECTQTMLQTLNVTRCGQLCFHLSNPGGFPNAAASCAGRIRSALDRRPCASVT